MLASHANAALAAGTALRLPAHPAFMSVRRARCSADGGDGVQGWFDGVRQEGLPLAVADAGLDGDALLSTTLSGWRVAGGDVPLSIEPAAPCGPVHHDVVTATDRLRAAARDALDQARGEAPGSWSQAVVRALAILDSAGTGEELSDVAWPHFLLPGTFPLPQRRLAAAAATLWLWEGPGAWTGPAADLANAGLREPVAQALTASVAS